jgi:hypothetical protein
MIKFKGVLAVFGSQIFGDVEARAEAQSAQRKKENDLLEVFRAFLAIHRKDSYSVI